VVFALKNEYFLNEIMGLYDIHDGIHAASTMPLRSLRRQVLQ
jgi:hypothetical protein